jgi:short-subunit dehydrogenase
MNKTVLITGASSGLGKDFATLFAEKGYDLVLTARRKKNLEEIKDNLTNKFGIKAFIISCDLSDLKSTEEIYNFCEDNKIQINVLVNNAGYGLLDSFEEVSLKGHIDFINVLSTSAIALTRLFLPGMIKRKFGRIINISSVAAFAPYTNSGGMYIATKLMLLKFSEMIHNDYNNKNVFSCSVCPGFTHTEFHKEMKEYKSSIPSFMWMDSRTVVEQAYEASMSGKEIIINGWRYKILVFLMKITPKWLVKLLSGR